MANAMLQHDSEKERFQKLITDTICMLCKSSFSTQPRITVDGLLGITLSSDEVFLVKINQTITNDYISSPTKSVKEEVASPNDEIAPPVFPMSKTSIFGSRRSQPSKPESRNEDIAQDDDDVDDGEEEEEEGLEDNKLIIDHEKENNDDTNCKNGEASAPNSTSVSSATTPTSSSSSSSSTSHNAIPFENLLKMARMSSKPQSCTECGATFPSAFDLSKHTLTHIKAPSANLLQPTSHIIMSPPTAIPPTTPSSPPNFPCYECGKLFKAKSELQIHIRIHTGYRPYKCTQCGKGFTQKSAMNRHLWTHTNSRPFYCDICHKGFLTKQNLNSHLASHVHRSPLLSQQMSSISEFQVKQQALMAAAAATANKQPLPFPTQALTPVKQTLAVSKPDKADSVSQVKNFPSNIDLEAYTNALKALMPQSQLDLCLPKRDSNDNEHESDDDEEEEEEDDEQPMEDENSNLPPEALPPEVAHACRNSDQ
ncbi:DgyrCDS3989 [Dimorphilus gyrociliatus]|nr:DgyrCDS3989 [Dimorphilus gyrociliatus]